MSIIINYNIDSIIDSNVSYVMLVMLCYVMLSLCFGYFISFDWMHSQDSTRLPWGQDDDVMRAWSEV